MDYRGLSIDMANPGYMHSLSLFDYNMDDVIAARDSPIYFSDITRFVARIVLHPLLSDHRSSPRRISSKPYLAGVADELFFRYSG